MAKINDLAGNFLVQTFTPPDLSAIVVDGQTPKISNVSLPTGSKFLDDNLDFVVTTTKAVTVNASSGTPAIVLNIGGTTKYALYHSGSGTTSITFRYTVESGLYAPTSFTANPSIQMRGGTLKSSGGANLEPLLKVSNVAFDGTVSASVDSLDPVIVSVRSTPSIYNTDQVFTVKIRTNKPITVSGTPQIALNINSGAKNASYASGSGSTTLVFTYTVVSGDVGDYGEFSLGAIDLNSGTLNDANAAALSLTYTSPNMQSYAFNSTPTADTVRPQITDVTMPADGTYACQSNQPVPAAAMIVTFSEPVKTYSGYWLGPWRCNPVVSGTNNSGSSTLNVKKLGSSGTIQAGTRFKINNGDTTWYTVTTDATISSHTAALSITPVLADNASDNVKLIDEFDTGWGLVPVVTAGASAGATSISIDGLCYDSGLNLASNQYLQDGDVFTLNGHQYTLANNGSVLVSSGAATFSISPPLQTSISSGDTLSDFRWNLIYYAFHIQVNTSGSAMAYAPISGFGTDTWTYVPIPDYNNTNTSLSSFKTNQAGGSWNIYLPHAYNYVTYVMDMHGNELDTANGKIPSPLPTVTGITFTSTRTLVSGLTLPALKNYISGEQISVDVTFSDAVTISADATIAFDMGAEYDQYGSLVTPGTPARLTYSSTTDNTCTFTATVGNDWDAAESRVGFLLDQNGELVTTGTITGSGSYKPNLNIYSAFGGVQIRGLSFNNTTDVSIPTIKPADNVLPADGNYITDQDIRFGVKFDEDVYVTGNPYIELSLNGVITPAAYEKTVNRTIYFKYRVKPTDIVAAGNIAVGGTGLIVLPAGAAIVDRGTNVPTDLTHNLVISPAISFNAALDTSSAHSISVLMSDYGGPKRTFVEYDWMQVEINFNKTVVVDNNSGIPYITVDINSTPLQLDLQSSGNVKNLVFGANVGSARAEAGEFTITSPIVLNGGTIKDYFTNNNAVLTFTSSTGDVTVNSIVPLTVSSLTVTPSSGFLITDDVITFRTTFNQKAKYSDFDFPPAVQFKFGGTSRQAQFTVDSNANNSSYSINDVNWAEYAYTIQGGDGGSMSDVVFGLIGTPGWQSLSNRNYKMFGQVDSGNSTTTTIRVHSPGDFLAVTDYYKDWEARVTISAVQYTRTITAFNGTTCEFTLDTALPGVPSDYSEIYFTPAITLPDVSGIQANQASPTILSGSVTPGTYNTNDDFDITLVFSEAVHVHGTPNMLVYFAEKGRWPTYQSGSGTDTLVFRVSIDSDLLAGYGTVHTADTGQYSNLQFTNTNYIDSNTTAGLKVYPLTLPAIDFSGVRINHTNADDLTIDGFNENTGTRIVGDTITITAYMSEPTTFDTGSGTPYVTGVFDSGNVQFAYYSGSGSSIINFTYTLQANDFAYNPTFGPIVLNGGTITAGAKNVITSLNSSSYQYLLFKVDTIDPVITTITAPAGTYHVGDTVTITVNINEPIDMFNQYRTKLNIKLNNVAHQIPYHYDYNDVRWRNYMKFDYTVQPGDNDLLEVVSIDFKGTGSTFTDLKGTALDATITPPDLSGVVVDTTDSKFGVSSWSVSPSGNVGPGDVINITMNLTKSGTVNSTPRLYVRYADYPNNPIYVSPYSGSGTSSIVWRTTIPGGYGGVMTLDPEFSTYDSSNKITNSSDTLSKYFWEPSLGVTSITALPTITSVTAPTSGNYNNGQSIRITVTTSRLVQVTGTPKIGLLLNGDFKWATYVDKDGLDLHFDYTVGAEECPLGTVLAMSNIEISSGNITDAQGNWLASTLFDTLDCSAVSTNIA